QLLLTVWTNENKPLDLELEDLSGKTTRVTVIPLRSEDSPRAAIGIKPLDIEAVDRIMPGMPAELSGLKTGDIILTYNHKTSDNETMSKLIETVNESAGLPLVLTILRDEQVLDVTVVPEKVSVLKGVEFDGNIVVYVDGEEAGPAASTLRPGDIVTAVDGEPLPDGCIADALTNRIYSSKDDKVQLTIERSRGLFREPQRLNVSVALRQKGMIGVFFSPLVMEKFSPGQAFIKSLDAFGHSFSLTIRTLYYLVTGKVSTREIAGPIGIAFLTEESLKLGVGFYLNLVAFITINLAILNLLPIPVLDGGLILISLIESVRRKPLDEKYLIALQKLGLVFILFLVLLATYNDILRAINRFLGGTFME
ncbi:MAG: site-2 protease family protein, partial [Candidatus Hydrogenedentota bacterium]